MPNTVPDHMDKHLNEVHVAVAVIVKNNRVLISKRPEHVHQGGLWEFPGGKVEPGEPFISALKREIQEELAIKVLKCHPLIKIAHHYPDKSVLLEAHIIEDFEGQQYPEHKMSLGSEGQAVQWVEILQLKHYAFPAANQAIINALQLPQIYAISPNLLEMDTLQLQIFKKMFQKYLLVQLRFKTLEGERLEQMVAKVFQLAQGSPVRLLLNSAMELNTELHDIAAGVHLSSAQLADTHWVRQYQQQFPEKLLAASCHNTLEVAQANDLKLDFMAISPVQRTLSHPQQLALGWDKFAQLTAMAQMPVYALGGMNPMDVDLARSNGAQGIAGIRSLFS